MRITGLATGLDIDEIVKSSLIGYRSKINTQQQKKEILEIKQTLYRDLMNESKAFYDKYFSLSGKDSLLLSKDYSSVGFKSSNEGVASATGTSTAKESTFDIDVKHVAKGSCANIAKDYLVAGNMIKITNSKGETKEYVLEGNSPKEIANNLTSKLSKDGFKAEYSDFARELKLETTELGENTSFELSIAEPDEKKDLKVTDGNAATKANATIKSDDVKDGTRIEINGEVITLTGNDPKEIASNLNKELSTLGIEYKASYNSKTGLEIKAKNEGHDDSFSLKVNGTDISVDSGIDGVKSNALIDSSDIVAGNKLLVNGRNYELRGTNTDDIIKNLNSDLSKLGSGVSAFNDNGNIKLEYKTAGTTKFTASLVSKDVTEKMVIKEGEPNFTKGTDAEVVIKDAQGNEFEHKGTTNTVTKDGVTFTFNQEGTTTLSGKKDVTELKDKIVRFVNDYNNLMTSLNKQIQTKHNRNYVPLTSDQKKEMTDKEIELWEAKVKEGQLYKDTHLSKVANNLKSVMRTYDNNLNLNLEKIGIVPVADYSGTGNGTFTIDEEKLTKALEENGENVTKFLIGDSATNTKGILYELKETLETDMVKSSSTLAKKAGLEGTSTFSNNEITKQISAYETKLKEMDKLLATKEQTLYSKWASIEKMMNKMNAQQASLASYFGS